MARLAEAHWHWTHEIGRKNEDREILGLR